LGLWIGSEKRKNCDLQNKKIQVAANWDTEKKNKAGFPKSIVLEGFSKWVRGKYANAASNQ